MGYYDMFLKSLDYYFSKDKNWKKLFLEGGCFWFASTLQKEIDPSFIYINRIQEHCALFFDHALYDVSGQISDYGFHQATPREIQFMRKNYVPRFDIMKLQKQLEREGVISVR